MTISLVAAVSLFSLVFTTSPIASPLLCAFESNACFKYLRMESEMEWRRRQSGEPGYGKKRAADSLDAACNVQAQRWLRAGGRDAAPPLDAATQVTVARDAAVAAGVSSNAPALRRANALIAALDSANGAADVQANAGAMDDSPPPPKGYELPTDFDGTRRNVARAERAGRWQSGGVRYRRDAFVNGPSNPEGALIVNQVSRSIDAREALDEWVSRARNLDGGDRGAREELRRLIDEAKAAGLGEGAPSMRRAVALDDLLAQGQVGGDAAFDLPLSELDADSVPAATSGSVDAKLDQLFSGYADPAGGDEHDALSQE